MGKHRKDNRKLVATKSCYHLTFIQNPHDALCDGLKNSISGGVTAQIVDFFEPVEAEEQNSELLPRCFGRLDLLIKSLVETVTIGKSGKQVVMRQISDMIFRFLACAKIAHGNRAVYLPSEINSSLD